MSFSKNVFVNCPFDDEYFPLLKAILFTLIYLDYNPLISETSDSGESRLLKIKDMIAKSKFSIHDISRVELNKEGLPRFNMPLECGIDFGIKLNGNARQKEKSFLILERDRFRYQKFMSDIAGNDIRAHNNKPDVAIKHVRDWIKINTGQKLDWPSEIWFAYSEFLFDYQQMATTNKYDPNKINAITFSDLIELSREWIKAWKEG